MADTTEIDIVISDNLKRLIGDEYGAQIAIARKINITPGGLNRIVKGKAHAGPKVVADLARALGVNEVDLYQVYKPPEPPKDDPVAVQVLEYKRDMLDAGIYMTRMQRRIEELEHVNKEQGAKLERISMIPDAIIEKLTRLNWRAKGIVAQLKIAMRPFLKESDRPIRQGRKPTQNVAGTG